MSAERGELSMIVLGGYDISAHDLPFFLSVRFQYDSQKRNFRVVTVDGKLSMEEDVTTILSDALQSKSCVAYIGLQPIRTPEYSEGGRVQEGARAALDSVGYSMARKNNVPALLLKGYDMIEREKAYEFVNEQLGRPRSEIFAA